MLVFLEENASISPNARVVPVSPESGIPACSNLVLKPQPHRGLFLNFTAVRIASKFTEGGANDRCNVSHRSQTGSARSFRATLRKLRTTDSSHHFSYHRNREDAEDAVQDAFLKAFTHLKDFDGLSSFST